MADKKADKKKNEKAHIGLKWQLGLIVSLFYVIIVAAGMYIIYYSSTTTYLTAKNDMISRDLNIITNDNINENNISWLMRYWRAHPKEVREEMTPEEEKLADSVTLFGNENKGAAEMLRSMTPEQQLAIAKKMYRLLYDALSLEVKQDSYGCIFIVDITETNRGFIYCEVGETEDGSYQWDYDLENHPAAKKFLDGEADDIEFELSDDARFGKTKYYIGCKPLMVNGKPTALICLGYNWGAFYNDLISSMRTMAALTLAGMLVLLLLTLVIVNAVVTKPLGVLKDAALDFAENKDSKRVTGQIDSVRSRNEIGVLAGSFNNLVVEIDDHIKRIKEAEDEIRDLSNNILLALVQTIDAKDKYTKGHSKRVATYSRMIAERMGYDKEQRNKIHKMGLLHDIGKIGIPDEIINKPSKLTDEEYAVIKSHTIQGYDILSRIDSFPELAMAARWHHERCDGKGYPDGLRGDEVPLEVRIISVADSYDTMTSNRSYRKFLPQEVAHSEIEKNAGTQFDPEIAKVMLEIIDEDKDYRLHE